MEGVCHNTGTPLLIARPNAWMGPAMVCFRQKTSKSRLLGENIVNSSQTVVSPQVWVSQARHGMNLCVESSPLIFGVPGPLPARAQDAGEADDNLHDFQHPTLDCSHDPHRHRE